MQISDELEEVLEILDNSHRKNNIRLTDLKEGVKGASLLTYVTELFTAWFGADSETPVSIDNIYRIGAPRPVYKSPRDILVRFSQCSVKVKVLEYFWKLPEETIEGFQVFIYENLSPITLRRRNNFKFLTAELQVLLIDGDFPLS